MSQTIGMKCSGCKETFVIEPYFHNAEIFTRDDGFNNHRRYVATVIAKATCPLCGVTAEQVCENEIYTRNIIDLAIQRHKRG